MKWLLDLEQKPSILGSKFIDVFRYGFLSENCDFVKLCEQNNIQFIGPPFSAISAMGSKIESKKIMENAKVPVVPGYYGDNQDKDFLIETARGIQYPIMIKADLGGGGKGMRIVHNENEFYEALVSAQNESSKSFGSAKILLEKYIANSRHIEVQVFGDKYKNYVHLFERDCTIQRRHQKVVEEAPSYLPEDIRQRLCKSATQAAEAVGYVNAGTVEFIYDIDFNKFYFMEMNTRLQVEHPITEMITKQDLVEWQLLIAAGGKIPKKQEELKIHGHAIEARIYSEDPNNNFLPGSGKIIHLDEPKHRHSEQNPDDNIRIETGVREGDEVSVFYDPMISKLVCWAPNRDLAIKKTLDALDNYKILGLPNNIKFCQSILAHPQFQKWDFDTNFIAKFKSDLIPEKQDSVRYNDILFTVLSQLVHEGSNLKSNNTKGDSKNTTKYINPWNILDNFRVNYTNNRRFKLRKTSQSSEEGDKSFITVEVRSNHKDDSYHVTITDKAGSKSFEKVSIKVGNNNEVTMNISGDSINKAKYLRTGDGNIRVFSRDINSEHYVIITNLLFRILFLMTMAL